jgi:long-chain acyl-CoA synthetase
MHLYPVDAAHPGAALEIAERVLKTGNVQVWFPEGWRSPDGRLQRFLPGIGRLVLRSGAPAVPTYVKGAFEALPRGRRIPKFRRITVTFGVPEQVASLRGSGMGGTDEERVTNGLRQRLIALAAKSGDAGELVVGSDHPADTSLPAK